MMLRQTSALRVFPRIACFLSPFLLCGTMSFTQSAAASPRQGGTSPTQSAAQSQAAGTIKVPANTQIPLALTSAVSSSTAYVGMPFYCRTVYPIDINNLIVIPVGTYVKGTVTEVRRAGHFHRRALLGLRFDSMILPSGVSKTFAGTLAGFAGNGKEGFKRTESRIKGPGDKARDAETIILSGAEGAGIGSIAGISSGHSGVGAAAGAAGGGILGTILVLAGRGKNLMLPTGTNLQLELTRPLVFYRYQIGPPVESPSGPAFPRRRLGPG